MKNIFRYMVLSLVLAFVASPSIVRAHCDTWEGPVVSAARVALAQAEVTPVLMWVKPADEAAVRAAFAKTLAVRKQSKEAAELADTWFFETLVRIHRSGEGAPYTGLKSGEKKEPGVTAADQALDSGKVNVVLAETIVPLQKALALRFERVAALKPHAGHNVEAGREFVEAYVDYVHFAERLASLAATTASNTRQSHRH
ncbi:MAG: DUF6448 family protein [Nibricoccus sp.]